MACPAIITGDRFVSRLIEHIDCQSRYLGSYGYEALGQSGSTASLVVTGLLTLFVALFGIRLLFGPTPAARDVVLDVLKIDIVLTLAFSWPAFRTVIHDAVLDAPAEIAGTMGGSLVAPQNAGLTDRLQQADSAMVRLTELGTGRQIGQFVDSEDPGSRFGGVAIEDDGGFGYARVVWIAGLIGSLALLRIAGGLLLAFAPLAAALLLFEATRGLFSGWLRGLVLALVGMVAVTIATAVELSVLEPWLADALRLRMLGYAAPSAPTELLAMTLAFTLVKLGMIWLMGRIAWQRGWLTLPAIPVIAMRGPGAMPAPAGSTSDTRALPSRAERISQSMETTLRRETSTSSSSRTDIRQLAAPASAAPSAAAQSPDRLGNSWRRSAYRGSRAASERDRNR
ncbi:type IV secretion system protein [Erythrobacter sp. A6_0]|jgi:type IV secretion system protein VirB6|uniref:type IV secretion system protein n=1 Tax=Erythrobacter sp. A6_0 TaxID=2821089 RepID=UPI001AD99425|nr:type IV secretion system protein [Erythrobacter sp. A6_0]MBO9511613.1 type IV secretion system protein [Erythrobacter sp. A6_0]